MEYSQCPIYIAVYSYGYFDIVVPGTIGWYLQFLSFKAYAVVVANNAFMLLAQHVLQVISDVRDKSALCCGK